MDCLFCKIAAGEIPSTMVYSDNKVCVFNDIDPKAPVHLLVIPREHIESAAEISAANSHLTAHIFEVIAKLARESDFAAKGFRIVTNCGESAGQSVKHLHFHVLSGRDMSWPPG